VFAIGATDNPFRFGGLYGYWRHMAEPVYVRARYLNVVLGRWLSRDPLVDPEDDARAYAYVGSSPVSFVDPSGLRCVGSHFASSGPKATKNLGEKIASGKGKVRHEGCAFHFKADWGLHWRMDPGDTSRDCRVYQFYNDGGAGWTKDNATAWPLPSPNNAFRDAPSADLKRPMGFRGPLTKVPWSVQFVTCVCGVGDRQRPMLVCFKWGFKFVGVMGQGKCAVKPFVGYKASQTSPSDVWGLIPYPWGGGT